MPLPREPVFPVPATVAAPTVIVPEPLTSEGGLVTVPVPETVDAPACADPSPRDPLVPAPTTLALPACRAPSPPIAGGGSGVIA